MHFSRLRLNGFKSFVDPVELLIEPGLTGVVGPNGCGKSNLLEAIRWVMGETRVRSMRGGAMEDVIFAGSDLRPAKGAAEVSLVLDNSDRRGPSHFNTTDLIEITRRIERGQGSQYRIDGEDVRQKDVQLLFADVDTGAHSPALVSQGRISALISAKPEERRLVLEEAAGISGLYSRRREAEIRLRAASNNLIRLDDVTAGLETQISSLKRQARQAERYKDMSHQINQAEALLMYLRWHEAARLVIRQQSALKSIVSEAADKAQTISRITRKRDQLDESLQALRRRDADASAVVQTLMLELSECRSQDKRRQQTITSLNTQLDIIRSDLKREHEIQFDARGAMEKLKHEHDRLHKELIQIEKDEIGFIARANEAEENRDRRQIEFDEKSGVLAVLKARKTSLIDDREILKSKDDYLCLLLATLKDEEQKIRRLLPVGDAIKSLENCTAELHEKINSVADALEAASADLVQALERERLAGSKIAGSEAALTALKSEAETLSHFLNLEQETDKATILSKVRIKPGFEEAFSAALGASAAVGVDPVSDQYWSCLPGITAPEWHKGLVPLADCFDECPDELLRRVSYTGVCDSAESFSDHIDGLLPGQMLVTTDGALCRWDGYRSKKSGDTDVTKHLKYRNQLVDITVKIEDVSNDLAEIKAEQSQATILREKTVLKENQLRRERADLEGSLAKLQSELQNEKENKSRLSSQLTGIEERANRICRERTELTEKLNTVDEDIKNFPDIASVGQTLNLLKEKLEEARARSLSSVALRDKLTAKKSSGHARLKDIEYQETSWKTQASRADEQIHKLGERQQSAQQSLKQNQKQASEFSHREQTVLEKLNTAKNDCDIGKAELDRSEIELSTLDQSLKSCEKQFSEIREQQIRAETTLENYLGQRKDLASEIGEKWGCAASKLPEIMALGTDKLDQSLEEVRKTVDGLAGKRVAIGAVNLRASEELEEIEHELATLLAEKEELSAAIAHLRGVIGSLNREGRQRLMAAFETVNTHFQALFKSLFGGGSAHLELTRSDDPLEAGLEIYASPPGKKLQLLSLLSGGEQALTATSLIFAVFMTNPAPICVLDEVDAPLDDANVGLFCNLLDDMAKKTETRFLIVTHNAVTMSRMDRLYGVTMAERAISKLVSVDLNQVEDYQISA